MQDLTAFDEHGLYVRGNIWGAVLLLLCIAAAGAMLGAIWYLKNHERLVSPAGFGAAHAGGGVIRRAAWLIIAVFMAVACFALLLTAGSSQYASLLRVLALLGLLADAGFAGMAAAGGRGDGESSGASPLVCLACVLPVAFCCFWLVVSYRQDAATAVVWRYGPEITAIACSLLAFYYLAGHAFGRPRAYTAMFFCACGAFLCFTALPDSPPDGAAAAAGGQRADAALFPRLAGRQPAPRAGGGPPGGGGGAGRARGAAAGGVRHP